MFVDLLTSLHTATTPDSRTLTPTLYLYKPSPCLLTVNEAVHTPNIDQLKVEGVTADMYSYKFCSPTRAAFLTGRYPWRITSTLCDGRVCNYLPATTPMGVHLGYSMLPKRLSEMGYTSFHVGK